jgi:hypothetical protein
MVSCVAVAQCGQVMTDTSIIARPRSLDETGQRPCAHLPGSPGPPFQIQGAAIHLGDDAEDRRAAANCSFRIDLMTDPMLTYAGALKLA